MFKKSFLLVLSVCFLFGWATKEEVEGVEGVEGEVEEKVVEDTMTAEVEEDVEPKYQISAAKISNLAQGDTISNVIFGETEVTVSEARALGVSGIEQKSTDERVKVKYPKVVMVSDRQKLIDYGASMVEYVKFFDLSGKVKKEVLVKNVFSKDKDGICWVNITDNRQYFALYTHVSFIVKNEYREKEVYKTQIVVFNVNGDELWKIDQTEFPIAVLLSPNAEYLVGAPDTEWNSAPVLVYSKSGKILKKIEKDDQGCRINFSNDGSYFAVVVTRIDWELKTENHYDRISSDLVVVNNQGNELWRKEKVAKGWEASGVKVKISGDTIVVITGEFKVYYFSKDGKLLKVEKGNIEQYRSFKG